jgi:hypothetical protein
MSSVAAAFAAAAPADTRRRRERPGARRVAVAEERAAVPSQSHIWVVKRSTPYDAPRRYECTDRRRVVVAEEERARGVRVDGVERRELERLRTPVISRS